MLKKLFHTERFIEMILALGVIVIVMLIVTHTSPSHDTDELNWNKSDSIAICNFEKEIIHQKEQRRKSFAQHSNKPTSHAGKPFPFDPNTTDSISFLRLGLSPRVAHNALNYRRKKGRWKSKEHFKNLYGLKEKDFVRLQPYINIHKLEQKKYKIKVQRPKYKKQEKFEHLVLLDANTADTNTLKKIPGIGSYYAQKICRYRERLGGFINKKQLAEIQIGRAHV